MLAFVFKRLVWAVILAWLVTLICFIIFFALPRNQPGSNRQGTRRSESRMRRTT